MKRQMSRSLLVAAAFLTHVLPAHANPFETNASPLFNRAANPAVLTAPTAPAVPAGHIGIVTPPSATNANSNSGASSAVGNQEISGLGNHDSWIDQNTLSQDPRAMCSDVGLGSNTTASSGSNSSSRTNVSSSSRSDSNHDSGGGGFSFLGIGANGSGSAQNSNQQNQSSDDRRNDSTTHASNSSTVQVGRNCDAFVQSAAARDMNYEDNLTERYGIRVGRRGNQVDGLLETPRN